MSLSTIKHCIIAGLLSATGALALAQQPAAEADPSTLSDRTKRQADNPYKWIMILDDKPRPKKEEAKEKRTAPVAAPARESAPAAAAAAPARAERAITPAAPPTAAQAAVTPAVAPTLAATKPAPIIETVAPPVVPAPAPTLASASPKLVEEEFEEPLRALKQVQPEMTRQIMTSGFTQGSVRVKFTVNPDGSVSNAEVLKSTNRVFNSPVLAALNQWQYAPIKQARETQAEIAFDFR